MRSRFASLLVILAIAGSAHAAAGATSGPTGLHGFLLRADEPRTTAYHRTPSFAWDPVPGALRYQFQLATSSTFRDNGILYNDAKLVTPVAAPRLTLPWITGSPHALYARVRAVMPDGADTTSWSAPFGFDVTPPPPPTPLPSYPSLLRWTPVDGADRYEVWLIDASSDGAGRFVTTRTNVLDEREFYTLHQSQTWTGTIRWRIRAQHWDYFNYRVNGLPVTTYGAWSPIYSSTNPAVSNGRIALVGTVSDVFSNGGSGTPAHELMPAFVWTGNQSLSGRQAELFRVYAFTDSQCLNRVYASPAVGTQTYAPRLSGPLQLPTSDSAMTIARSGFLGQGPETSSFTYDSENLGKAINEQLPPPAPTTSVPGDAPSAPGTSAPPDQSGQTDTSSTPAPASDEKVAPPDPTSIGPPVDLWDVNWPEGGYYWTVVPVSSNGIGSSGAAVVDPGAGAGTQALPVDSTVGFHIGDTVTVGSGDTAETLGVSSVGAGSLGLNGTLKYTHGAGETVSRLGGTITYQDLELPQDVCAAGRVQRFGVASEPSLTTAQSAFATGLSSTGRLVSARKTATFYGQPLVAWTPALGASVYQIQWSEKDYPFKAVGNRMTFATATVLPLSTGTWYYRVRGIDWSLPSGAQQMSWSDPQKIQLAKPTFRVAKAVKKRPKFKIVGSGSK